MQATTSKPTYKIDANGCWNWSLGKFPHHSGDSSLSGYGKVNRGGEQLAHRLFYKERVGEIPEGMCVLHKCDNPPCVNPEHLFLGTFADNNRDRDAKGRHTALRGDDNGNAKLSQDDFVEVKSLLVRGISHREIANLFGVTKSAITHISTGRNWNKVLV